MIGTIGDQVAMHQRGDAGQILIDSRRAALTESLNDPGNLQRIPNQDGVGDQTQAARLVHDLLVVSKYPISLKTESVTGVAPR